MSSASIPKHNFANHTTTSSNPISWWLPNYLVEGISEGGVLIPCCPIWFSTSSYPINWWPPGCLVVGISDKGVIPCCPVCISKCSTCVLWHMQYMAFIFHLYGWCNSASNPCTSHYINQGVCDMGNAARLELLLSNCIAKKEPAPCQPSNMSGRSKPDNDYFIISK
jgi:hypothetical protein